MAPTRGGHKEPQRIRQFGEIDNLCRAGGEKVLKFVLPICPDHPAR